MIEMRDSAIAQTSPKINSIRFLLLDGKKCNPPRIRIMLINTKGMNKANPHVRLIPRITFTAIPQETIIAQINVQAKNALMANRFIFLRRSSKVSHPFRAKRPKG